MKNPRISSVVQQALHSHREENSSTGFTSSYSAASLITGGYPSLLENSVLQPYSLAASCRVSFSSRISILKFSSLKARTVPSKMSVVGNDISGVSTDHFAYVYYGLVLRPVLRRCGQIADAVCESGERRL